MQPITCSHCGQSNAREYRFCTGCGKPLAKTQPKGVARLVYLNRDPGKVLHLRHLPASVGRDPQNTLVIEDPQVSKFHARIFEQNGRYWVEDLESRNGVYVNGLLVHGKKKLVEGSLVKIGGTILRFELFDNGI